MANYINLYDITLQSYQLYEITGSIDTNKNYYWLDNGVLQERLKYKLELSSPDAINYYNGSEFINVTITLKDINDNIVDNNNQFEVIVNGVSNLYNFVSGVKTFSVYAKDLIQNQTISINYNDIVISSIIETILTTSKSIQVINLETPSQEVENIMTISYLPLTGSINTTFQPVGSYTIPAGEKVYLTGLVGAAQKDDATTSTIVKITNTEDASEFLVKVEDANTPMPLQNKIIDTGNTITVEAKVLNSTAEMFGTLIIKKILI